MNWLSARNNSITIDEWKMIASVAIQSLSIVKWTIKLNLYDLTDFTQANLPNLRRSWIVVFVFKVWIIFAANSGLPHK